MSTFSHFDDVEHNPFADSNPKIETKNGPSFETNTTSTNFPPHIQPIHQDTMTVPENPETQWASDDENMEIQNNEENFSKREALWKRDFEVPSAGVQPFFKITVANPHKVGDTLNPYTAYAIETKTNSSAFKDSTFTVKRRYRDFLWLYNQLVNAYPGVFIPPPPDKHAIGRFQDEFVENRRALLQTMLRKIAAHPMLYGDPDLKTFLESESFSVDVSERKKENSKSIFKAFGDAVSSATFSLSRFTETDEWFIDKKAKMEDLETQLRALYKTVDGLIKQRKDLSCAFSEFGESLIALSATEINKPLSEELEKLAKVQKELGNIENNQASNDLKYLENTVDEYLRLIGSIKAALNTRIRAYFQWQTAITNKQKQFSLHEKSKQGGKPEREERIVQEVKEAEEKEIQSKEEFMEISRLIKSEFERFDKERMDDFQKNINDFLQSVIESQEKVVQLWCQHLATFQ